MKPNARPQLLRSVLAATLCLLLFGQATITAQPAVHKEQETTQAEPVVERDPTGRVTVKLLRGVRVALGNRTTGRITVTGWDNDTIEATATSERGVEYVQVKTYTDASGTGILIKADYASEGDFSALGTEGEARRAAAEQRRKESEARRKESEARRQAIEEGKKEAKASLEETKQKRKEARLEAKQSKKEVPGATSPDAPPTQTPPAKPSAPTAKPPEPLFSLKPPGPFLFSDSRPAEVHLEVKLPRKTEIELITVSRSELDISGIETPLIVNGEYSTIRLSRVGAVEVRNKSGLVEVEKASGLVDVITTSGPIRVREAGGDVRTLSISGSVEIECARGRVNVGNTDGSVSLANISGDVDATTTSGEIRLLSTIRGDGRYYLKSMSGAVEMSVRPSATGFTATLSSYRGIIETAFPRKISQSPKNAASNRRIIHRYGDGQAQITLDSFDGNIKLNRGPAAPRVCP